MTLSKHDTWWFLAPMMAYAIVLVLSLTFVRQHPNSQWRVPISVTPVVPLIFMAWGSVRRARALDELQRRVRLEGLAFGYPAGVLLMIGYGFLQNVGFPDVNWMWGGVLMIGLWYIGNALAGRYYQ